MKQRGARRGAAWIHARPITVVGPGIVPSPSVLERARELAPDTRQPLIEVAGDESAHTGVFRALPDAIARPRQLATRTDARRPWLPGGRTAGRRGRALLSLSVATHAELAIAERRLRQSIFKPTDGRLGRFNRRISMPISVGLIRWMRFSANAMSVLIIGLGLYAGWLFSRGDYVSGVLAALVSWAASVLDGCDGELARLQYTDSPFGCWLDTLGDYVVLPRHFHRADDRRRAADRMGRLLVDRRRDARRHASDVRPADPAARAHHQRSTGPIADRDQGTLLRQRQTLGMARRPGLDVATRATMPYGIVGFAVLGLLPGVLVLGAIGAQIYWICLAVELDGSSCWPRRVTADDWPEPADADGPA